MLSWTPINFLVSADEKDAHNIILPSPFLDMFAVSPVFWHTYIAYFHLKKGNKFNKVNKINLS